MSLGESVERMVLHDSREGDKHKIFGKLNQLARSRNIAVILHWMGMKDPAGNVWNDMRFHSNGPRGQAETCVFCGKRLRAGDWQRLGHFVSDRECFRDNFVDSGGVYFLPKTGFRPAVIIVPSCVPGSLDDVILDLAWALACYRTSVRHPYVARVWLHDRADSFAERLVRKLERTCRWPSRQELEPCERYIPRR
ncbi:MAG: hypothetical protein WAR21_12905 [Candidatus Acidiferrales bacterium]